MQQDPILVEYLKYSGGIYPTLQQYQYFYMTYQPYFQQMKMYPPQYIYYQQPQMQWYPIQNGIKVDDKFYIKTKEKCENGMECKNTYCQKFHHPGIDQINLILNK